MPWLRELGTELCFSHSIASHATQCKYSCHAKSILLPKGLEISQMEVIFKSFSDYGQLCESSFKGHCQADEPSCRCDSEAVTSRGGISSGDVNILRDA